MSISLQDKRTKRICLNAFLCALAMMLSYLEAILPLYAIAPLPGFRLGLANIVVVAAFFLLS
ncbi:MAG: Gx transporter family protein, partial [Clostridia bacterium]|nr:Gx transporter family protein [Clostridia bacterium]